jgi:hypothetical protein
VVEVLVVMQVLVVEVVMEELDVEVVEEVLESLVHRALEVKVVMDW